MYVLLLALTGSKSVHLGSNPGILIVCKVEKRKARKMFS